MKNNDERVLQLIDKVNQKRDEVAKMKLRYTPITNCLFIWQKNTYNLHVEDLEVMAIMVHSLASSAYDLGLEKTTKISGFTLDEWMQDIMGLLEVRRAKEEKKRLDALEQQLNALLSTDKKTEMELDSIASLLG